MRTGNLRAATPSRLAQELAETLAGAPGVRIERIVSTGQASPPGVWYDQDTTEWVALLEGAAALEFAERAGLVELAPGDWIEIPAHAPHRVAWTAADTRTVWLAVHYES